MSKVPKRKKVTITREDASVLRPENMTKNTLREKIEKIITGKVQNPAWDYREVKVTPETIDKILSLLRTSIKYSRTASNLDVTSRRETEWLDKLTKP